MDIVKFFKRLMLKNLPFGLRLIIIWFVIIPIIFVLFKVYGVRVGLDISSKGMIAETIAVIILSWSVAYFLVKKKNWIRQLLIIFCALGIVTSLLLCVIYVLLAGFARPFLNNFFIFILFQTIFSVVLNGLTIWYLNRADVSKLFSPEQLASINGDELDELKITSKWSWGAFFLSWIWGLGNRVYMALLVFLPIGNVVMPFILGLRGNKWAWQRKKWNDLEHFKRTQRRWTIAGLIVFSIKLIIILLIVIYVRKVLAQMRYDVGAQYQNQNYSYDAVTNEKGNYTDEENSLKAKILDDIPAPIGMDTQNLQRIDSCLIADSKSVWLKGLGQNKLIKLDFADPETVNGSGDFIYDKNYAWPTGCITPVSVSHNNEIKAASLELIAKGLFMDKNSVWFYDQSQNIFQKVNNIDRPSLVEVSAEYGSNMAIIKDKNYVWVYKRDISGSANLSYAEQIDAGSFKKLFDDSKYFFTDKDAVYGMDWGCNRWKDGHLVGGSGYLAKIEGASAGDATWSEGDYQVSCMPILRSQGRMFNFDESSFTFKNN